MPKVLPLPTMLVQRLVILANSCGLKVALEKGVSVGVKPAPGAACSVVPKERMPPASGKASVPANAALLVQAVPVKPGPAAVFTNFTTTELGRTPVSVLLTRSWLTERETKPFGVIKHEQQETSCSSGENAYTFTQMLPTPGPKPGPLSGAPLVPVLLMLMTESPAVRLEA